MGVEFRLGRQDGHKAEDFLAGKPAGVSAITLDTSAARYQRDAADAAREAGVEVLFDPATERMADLGFAPHGLPYFDGRLLDLDGLATDAAARTRLVTGVVDAHPDEATLVTPPHFLVHDDRSASLNAALAEETVLETSKGVRGVLVIARPYAVRAAARLAAEYRDAGVGALDLRITPLGGDNESARKIRSVFAVADAFTEADIEVTLGFSGNIGQTAMALGHVAHFSVGVGLRETVNHSAAISRQKMPPPEKTDDDGGGRFGAVAGIYLPGPAITVGRKVGKLLLAHTEIRTRIGCRIGVCGTSGIWTRARSSRPLSPRPRA